MTTPEPVSPAPDTEALREGRLWSVLDWSLWGNGLGDVLRSAMADVMIAALTPEQREQAEACIKSWHERRSPSMAVGVDTQLERERDEARAEVDRLKSYLLGRRNNLAQLLGQPASEEDTGWYGLCAQVQEREAGLRADLDQARRDRDALSRIARGLARRASGLREVARENAAAHHAEQALSWQAVRTAGRKHEREIRRWSEEVGRLRAELAGARTIPDDADDYVIGALARRMRNAGEPLSDAQTSVLVDVVTTLFRSWLSTPTTDPAPAAADPTEPYRELLGAIWLYVDWRFLTKQMTTEQRELWADAVDAFGEPQEGKAERWWREPAAPQAPAEPTGNCPRCHCAEPIHKTWCEPDAPAAREDAATPPLPLQDQADLLTWRVVHVPPGTTDREDTDTPITPGWWLVGHGDDPDHPDVQVHLGDRLPTTGTTAPGDEYNDDLGGWTRPAPIRHEEK